MWNMFKKAWEKSPIESAPTPTPIVQESKREESVKPETAKPQFDLKSAPLPLVVAACKARADVAPYARIVGAWVWVEFPNKPHADTRRWMVETGFRWNREREAWQHACGMSCTRNRRIDPRQVYGSQPIETEEPKHRFLPAPNYATR